MISTGSSGQTSGITDEMHINEVGNSYLHKRHQVGISKFDKTSIGRAIVFDQHLIDILFQEKKLDERQHKVCDQYLGMISKGMHMSSPPFGERLSTGKYYLAPVPRSCILIKVQRHLKKKCGADSENRFWFLMTSNPRSLNAKDFGVVRDCADALLIYYAISESSPVVQFSQALSARH